MATPAFDFEALRRLSVPERLQLVEDLWDSIVHDAPDDALPVTPDLAAELDSRLAQHEANPTDVVPWEVARARLLRE
jgi:putative addiction module component (TIGR02574 family)